MFVYLYKYYKLMIILYKYSLGTVNSALFLFNLIKKIKLLFLLEDVLNSNVFK